VYLKVKGSGNLGKNDTDTHKQSVIKRFEKHIYIQTIINNNTLFIFITENEIQIYVTSYMNSRIIKMDYSHFNSRYAYIKQLN